MKRIQGTKEYGAEVTSSFIKNFILFRLYEFLNQIFQKEQMRQSLQELRTLSKYRHDNILPLYAYSLDGPEPCLLYQYMSNGSLFDCLFGKVKFYGLVITEKVVDGKYCEIPILLYHCSVSIKISQNF